MEIRDYLDGKVGRFTTNKELTRLLLDAALIIEMVSAGLDSSEFPPCETCGLVKKKNLVEHSLRVTLNAINLKLIGAANKLKAA